MVNALLARGASCDVPDAFGETPAEMAMRLGNVNALQELLAYEGCVASQHRRPAADASSDMLILL